jgi:hypothetical protein
MPGNTWHYSEFVNISASYFLNFKPDSLIKNLILSRLFKNAQMQGAQKPRRAAQRAN